MIQDQSMPRGALRGGACALAGAALLVGAGTGSAAAATSGTFTISGSLSQVLFPGLTLPLNLSLSNPGSGLLNLSSLNVAITAVHPVSGSACTLNNFTVTQYSGPLGLVLPGSTTLTLTLLGVQLAVQPQVTMLETGVNQDACQGATLDLAYTGTATAPDGTPATGSGGSGSASNGSGSDSDGNDGSDAGSTGNLADTGANGHSTAIALAGVALAALGAGGVYAARRRKEHS